jgi:hypothetical protein
MTEEIRNLGLILEYYQHQDHDLRSVRHGYLDAAQLCDAIAADIRAEHTVKGKVTKRGEELAQAVTRAGDAIWLMRRDLLIQQCRKERGRPPA